MTKERFPYAHVYPLGSPGRLQPITGVADVIGSFFTVVQVAKIIPV